MINPGCNVNHKIVVDMTTSLRNQWLLLASTFMITSKHQTRVKTRVQLREETRFEVQKQTKKSFREVEINLKQCLTRCKTWMGRNSLTSYRTWTILMSSVLWARRLGVKILSVAGSPSGCCSCSCWCAASSLHTCWVGVSSALHIPQPLVNYLLCSVCLHSVVESEWKIKKSLYQEKQAPQFIVTLCFLFNFFFQQA